MTTKLATKSDDLVAQHVCLRFTILWTLGGFIENIAAIMMPSPRPTPEASNGFPFALVWHLSAALLLGIFLLRRRQVWLCSALTMWVFADFYEMPFIVNHGALAIVTNLTLIASICFDIIRRGRVEPKQSETRLISGSWETLRLMLLVVYFWAVIHKLNYDYLNPAVSSAWLMWCEIVRGFPMPIMEWMRWPVVIGGVSIEALILMLLCFQRTRILGLFLGLSLHFSFGHAGVRILAFQCEMYAFLSLFVPGEVGLQWWLMVKSKIRGMPPTHRWLLFMALVGMSAYEALQKNVFSFPAEFAGQGGSRRMIATGIGLPIFLVLSTLGGWLLLYGRSTIARYPIRAWPRGLPAVVPILILFLNGACPYLGLKTATAFSMYSNIRTEGGYCNHLFLSIIRKSVRFFKYQDDLVQVIDSNDPAIKENKIIHNLALHHPPGLKWRMTWFEFRRRLTSSKPAQEPDFFVVVEHNGKVERISRRDNPSHEAFQAPPWLLQKLLYFRLVNPNDGATLAMW